MLRCGRGSPGTSRSGNSSAIKARADANLEVPGGLIIYCHANLGLDVVQGPSAGAVAVGGFGAHEPMT